MKKFARKYLMNNLDIFVFFLSLIFLEHYFRIQLVLTTANTRIIFVSVFISLFFSSFMFLFSRRRRLIYGIIILLLIGLLCFCQNLHYNYFTTFFSFSKASILKEFFQVKNEATDKITLDLFTYFIPVFLFILSNCIKGKQIKYKPIIKISSFVFISILSTACLILTFSNYPNASKKSESDAYLYKTLYNKVRAVERLGLYAYTIKDAQLTLSNKASNTDEEKALIDLYIEEHRYTSEANEYTGLFKGKNMIIILCESL